MLTPIVLEYNKKYLNLESLYKLNLYYIDNEYYIDMTEVNKFNNWIRTVFYQDYDDDEHSEICSDCTHECDNNFTNCQLICKHVCDDKCNHLQDKTCKEFLAGRSNYPIYHMRWSAKRYNEDERKQNDDIYVKNFYGNKESYYRNISIETYLFNLVETSYRVSIDIFKKYEIQLNKLYDFQKPKNLYKQIISNDGEIIYVVNFKKRINNINNIMTEYKDFYNIKIEIESIFDINKLYPLDLKKILTERKTKVSPYTEL